MHLFYRIRMSSSKLLCGNCKVLTPSQNDCNKLLCMRIVEKSGASKTEYTLIYIVYELCYYVYLFGEEYSLFLYFNKAWSITVFAKILSLTPQLFNHDVHLNVKVLKSKNYPYLILIKVDIRWNSFVVLINWSLWLEKLWVFWFHDRNWTHYGSPMKIIFSKCRLLLQIYFL